MGTQEVNRILRRYHNDATDIIAILGDVQETYRHLPQEVLEHLARKLDIPLSRIYHLATFFRAFSLEPLGRHDLQVCTGTACHVRGASRLLDAIQRGLKIRAGQTTADRNFSLRTVHCTGACAVAPVVTVNGTPKGRVTPRTAKALIEKALAERKPGPRKAARKPLGTQRRSKRAAQVKKKPRKSKTAPAGKNAAKAAKKRTARPVKGSPARTRTKRRSTTKR